MTKVTILDRLERRSTNGNGERMPVEAAGAESASCEPRTRKIHEKYET